MATKTQVLRIETNGNAHIKMNNDSEWKDFTVNSHATAVIAQLAMTSTAIATAKPQMSAANC